ncbi:nuclear matrix constituent protein 1 [Triticum aestivum]|uniref:nuclear matrix constituent protein 1 n=1 Tax=Triticum aestivum TaxID=4565 RepID=UPI001D017A30|nr:nuclear matrix constituent protein 1-like [Triticum aestivum]
MRSRHSQKWQALKEQRNSANQVDQKLRGKGSELREWHGKQLQVLLRQQETISMAKEDVIARQARLAECTTLLNAGEKDVSSREENLAASLCSKDKELEGLVRQRTKELEDKHKVALDALSSDSPTQMKKVVDDLATTSSAKNDLDHQVAKLMEELAGSTKETTALKEEAQKAKTLLKEVQSKLSSKSQDLETANCSIDDFKARIGTLESSIESSGSMRSS